MTLQALYAAKLADSGIPEKDARRAKLSALPGAEVKKLWDGAPKQDALLIPYLDPLGQSTEFYRIRFLGALNGFAKQTEKPLRYLQPPKTGVHVYFPPAPNLRWLDVLADPKQPLVITEGELKALAATLAGFPTIGLGGVDSWHSKASNEPFLKDLEAIAWDGRIVYICYDSDAATKPQVAEAARRLADELGARGAQVFDAGLPMVGKAKVGLDDFIKLRGKKALEEHLNSVHEFANVAALHEFNERFVFVRSMAKIYEEARNQFYSAYNFINYIEATRTYTQIKTTPKGLVSTVRSVAADWVKWPNRRDVDDITYRPGDPKNIVMERGGAALNFWKGWGCEPKRGDVTPWRTLFEYLFSGESRDVKRWVEQWFAYPLQHPGTKLLTAISMWGAEQGTGKTLLGQTMIYIYGANGQMIGEGQLSSVYNSWIQRKQFIVGDEITGNDSRAYADKLKGIITSPTVRVNEKYQPEYDLPNCANFYFTSNHPDAFFIDNKDRRYLIVEAPDAPLPDSFYKEYDAWMKGDGPSHLFHYLKSVDLSGFGPNERAPRTLAHEIMSEVGLSEIGRYISTIISDPERAARLYKVPATVELFTAHELLTYYDPLDEKRVSERAVAVELQKQGAAKVLKGAQVQCANLGRLRLYAVRNIAYWKKATADQVRAAVKARHLTTAKY